MKQDEIIEMARQAGIERNQYMIYEALAHTAFVCSIQELEAFAKLVAAKERERICAGLRQFHDTISLASNSNAIRARGEA